MSELVADSLQRDDASSSTPYYVSNPLLLLYFLCHKES